MTAEETNLLYEELAAAVNKTKRSALWKLGREHRMQTFRHANNDLDIIKNNLIKIKYTIDLHETE